MKGTSKTQPYGGSHTTSNNQTGPSNTLQTISVPIAPRATAAAAHLSSSCKTWQIHVAMHFILAQESHGSPSPRNNWAFQLVTANDEKKMTQDLHNAIPRAQKRQAENHIRQPCWNVTLVCKVWGKVSRKYSQYNIVTEWDICQFCSPSTARVSPKAL